MREQLRGQVEAIRLVPEAGRLRVEARDTLGAILRLAENARGPGTDKRPGGVADAVWVQMKGDAETCMVRLRRPAPRWLAVTRPAPMLLRRVESA